MGLLAPTDVWFMEGCNILLLTPYVIMLWWPVSQREAHRHAHSNLSDEVQKKRRVLSPATFRRWCIAKNRKSDALWCKM